MTFSLKNTSRKQHTELLHNVNWSQALTIICTRMFCSLNMETSELEDKRKVQILLLCEAEQLHGERAAGETGFLFIWHVPISTDRRHGVQDLCHHLYVTWCPESDDNCCGLLFGNPQLFHSQTLLQPPGSKWCLTFLMASTHGRC